MTQSAFYLQPGQMHAGAAIGITTILGSCVAVCLWDSQGVGGMNHFLLPGSGLHPLRYAKTAVPRLVQRVLGAGARLATLQAKVFGGARIHGAPDGDHLGLRNANAALEILAASGIPVVAQDVGGSRGRRLYFNTQDGSVLVKYF